MREMVLVNPKAGMGRGKKIGEVLINLREEFVRKYGVELDVFETEPFGEKNSASNLAIRAAEDDYGGIITVSGDGTFNEAINSLVLNKVDKPIGIIPCGVGNDSAKNLGIPKIILKNIKKALITALWGREVCCDVGKMIIDEKDEKLFVNAVSFGRDAKIVEHIPLLKRRFPYLPAEGLYLFALLQELFFHFEYPIITLSFPEEGTIRKITKESTLLAVANGRQYGEMFKIAPGAIWDDGFLDVCWVEKMGKGEILFNLPTVLLGIHPKLSKVKMLKGASFEIYSPGIACQVDGDPLKIKERCQFSVLPKALRVRVP